MATVHAAGVLLTHGERALFLKRSDKSRDHAGEWCCPGGSIEGGETAAEAAARELTEETGLTGLLTGNLNQIDEGDGFVTFRQVVDDEPVPTLNEEHTEAVLAPLSDPPRPLHPGVAATLKKLLGGSSAQDKREYDDNGWYEVLDNPLSSVGVYQYSEASIRKGGDRNKMVGVYRPAEELGSQECINSFRLMPWTDDHPHDLFGDPSQGFATTEEKGVRGVIGEKVYFKDGTLYGNLKIFSEQLARKIAAGKRELSCGYHCQFLPQEGVYEGTPYQYVQKNMRGNHVSSVDSGRMGSGVRVLDAAEHTLSFALDLKESPMAREDEIKDCLDADTERFICDSFNSLVGELERKGYSKSYATKVAGKVAAEKGKTGHDSKSNGVTTVADKTPEELKKEKDAQDRKAARDSKRSARDSARAKDSLSAEEEEGMDAEEAAEDADEEKDDEKDESKEAKDRGRARDRRARARDARKGARDAKSARDAKAALDAAKGKGMDAAAVTEMVNKAVAAAVGGKALDATEITRQVTAAVVPAIRKEESAKAALYGRISPVIGAFDHSEMTHTQMAAYGLKKLGVAEPPADPVMALDFMLAGRNQVAQSGARSGTALDSATPSSIDALFDSLN